MRTQNVRNKKNNSKKIRTKIHSSFENDFLKAFLEGVFFPWCKLFKKQQRDEKFSQPDYPNLVRPQLLLLTPLFSSSPSRLALGDLHGFLFLVNGHGVNPSCCVLIIFWRAGLFNTNSLTSS